MDWSIVFAYQRRRSVGASVSDKKPQCDRGYLMTGDWEDLLGRSLHDPEE